MLNAFGHGSLNPHQMLVGGPTYAHIKKTEGIVCIQCVCVYTDIKWDLFVVFRPFISNGNQVRAADRKY